VSNENNSVQGSQASGVGQTANFGNHTSAGSGAAKVFREFKWGLLTLFLLMVVVIGLVYDGGKKKKAAELEKKPVDDRNAALALDGLDTPQPPSLPGDTGSIPPANPPRETARAPRIEGYTPTPPTIPVPPAPGLSALPPSSSQPPASHDRSAESRQHSALPVNPVPPAPATTVAVEKTYLVKPGDTLTGIAGTVMPGKNGLKAILDANKDVLPDPNRLRVGMVLKIPAASLAAAPAPASPETGSPRRSEAATPSKVSATEYTVQSGDTLERIARRLFNDGRKWRELYEWNREQIADPSRLRSGQVLKIKKDAQVSDAGSTTIPVVSGPVHTDELPAQASVESLPSPEKEMPILSRNSSVFAP